MFEHKKFITDIYPLHRTLVHDDMDKTMQIIANYLPDNIDFKVHRIPSDTQCWTWKIPKKFHVNHARLIDSKGDVIVDFEDHILHIASYSPSFKGKISHDELLRHLHYNESMPDSIPWIFNYYKDDWGLCLTYNKFKLLSKTEVYEVDIDTEFSDGLLNVGEVFIPGESDQELLLVTNTCHPCQVNDSITGVSAAIDLLHRIISRSTSFKWGLRVLFCPETIGSVAYFSQNESVISNIQYGIFTEMLGNEESLVLQKSFEGNTPIDDIAKESAVDLNIEIREAGFRGVCCNDELVCNGPGMRIPTVSISRSKGNYISYPEYHTDADTPENLNYDYILESVNWLEKMWDNLNEKKNQRVALINKGPIFLSGYDLWGIWGNIKGGKETFDKMMILFDGTNTLNTISKTLNLNYNQVEVIVDQLHENKLINYI